MTDFWHLNTDNDVLEARDSPWGISLDEFQTVEQLDFWVRHVAGKGWGTPAAVAELVDQFNRLNSNPTIGYEMGQQDRMPAPSGHEPGSEGRVQVAYYTIECSGTVMEDC